MSPCGTWILMLLALVGPASSLSAGQGMTGAPTEVVCPVCRVLDGETDPETVKAIRTWKGATYGFCSEKCARTFEADPEAYVLTVLPYPAPTFTVRSLAGEPIDLGDYEGKILLLDFWATWCAPCIKSMPELQKLHETYARDGVAILGLSVDENQKQVSKFLKKRKFTYPMAMDSEDPPAFKAYGVLAVPAAFLLNREGQVVARWLGRAAPEEVELEIRRLLDQGS